MVYEKCQKGIAVTSIAVLCNSARTMQKEWKRRLQFSFPIEFSSLDMF